MKLPTSNKTTSFGRKHYIKKGYYPAKLLDVKPYANKEGVLIPGNYGNQLIFEFAIYNKDENDKATVLMRFKEEGKDECDVIIPKFVYHQYKDKKNPGQFVTAITPKSAITKLLKALGWTFTEGEEGEVEINNLIGNWVEANVTDYPTKDNEGDYIASTIGDVDEINSGKTKDVKSSAEVSKEKPVEKEMKPEEQELKEKNEEKNSLETQLANLKKVHDDGTLSDEGFKTASEQIQSKIDALN